MNRLKIIVLFLFFLGSFLYGEAFPLCGERIFIPESQTASSQLILEKTVSDHPENAECILKLASLYLRSNRVSEGFDLIRRAYDLSPKLVENGDISKVLDLALRLSKLKEIASRENDYRTWNELGDTYFEIGIFDEAAKAYEKSLALTSYQTKIEILLALCYGNQGKIETSVSMLKKIVQRESYNFYANYYLGKVLKNSLDQAQEGQKYLLMAEYLLHHGHPKFESKNEESYLKNDLEFELGKK